MTSAPNAASASNPQSSQASPPRQKLENPWRPVGLLIALVLALTGDVALALGVPLLPVAVSLGVSGGVIGYAIVKRYRLERVSEEDLDTLPGLAQLQLLARLYCLSEAGGFEELRARLRNFSAAHRGQVFLWVAPPAVVRFAERLSGLPRPPAPPRIPAPLRRVRKLRTYGAEPDVRAEGIARPSSRDAAPPPAAPPRRRRRLKGAPRVPPGRTVVVQSPELLPCPICGVTVSSEKRLCPYCGAGLVAELRR